MLKRTHILFIALCALCVNQALPAQIFFGDVDQDFPLYDSSDPFGIITATNAIALSRSATNTAHAANALGVTATNDAAQALSLGISATNGVAEALAFTAAIAVLETNTVTRAGTNGWEVGSHASFLTSAPPQSVVSVNGQTGAVVITAESIGALTNEQDLAALRTYHYGSPDIVESPAEWFTFDGAGTIASFYGMEGRENVVIPWEIGGVPVTAVAATAFVGSGIVSLIAPQTVTTIGNNAFFYCGSLASVSLPQAQTVGDYAFGNCNSLTAVYMGQNAPAEATGVFQDITPPPNIYVTNPQATGWGATWNGAPVVRPPLYADAIHQAGELVATTGHVAQAIAAIPVPDMSSRVAVQSGHATNLAVSGWLALPQSEATNLVLRLVSSNEHIIVQEVYQ